MSKYFDETRKVKSEVFCVLGKGLDYVIGSGNKHMTGVVISINLHPM
jgi:hypothetical protein